MKNIDIGTIKLKLSRAVGNLSETYKIFKKITLSDSIEILFYDASKALLYDKVQGRKINTNILSRKSILGKVFFSSKPYLTNNIENNIHYDIATDNPFKINIQSQVIIPVIHNDKLLGLLRLSKADDKYDHTLLETIKTYQNSLKDIFLNALHQKSLEAETRTFSLSNIDIYKTVQTINSAYSHLLTHTECPEVTKLINAAKINLESISQYQNNNLSNISRIKKNLQNMSHKEGIKMRILIADDVHMNVKILNAMMEGDSGIEEILYAYDGIETLDVFYKCEKDGNMVNVIFLDHHMPGKLGSEIAQVLKNGVLKNSVIIVSITNDPDAIQNIKQLYNYNLSKPFSKTSVMGVVSKIKKDLSIS